MEIPMPKIIKKLWDLWELRFSLILSLSLQAFLILFSPLRKRTKSPSMFFLLWSAYLLADWTASFAVGIISNSQGQKNNCSTKMDDYDADILALWASFLLVHLGGPDTISAFSQEDNELWLRHLAAMVFQSMAAVYVFFHSLPNNRLWIPTIFMFVTGLIKYAERTISLYLASLDSFRESVVPNYATHMDKYRSMKEANLPTHIEMIRKPARRGKKSVDRAKEGKLTHTEVVLYAYRFFETFKGLIVDHVFYFDERNRSRDFLLERNDEDAFKVIEVELNFIYESFFSKVSVVYSSIGHFFRIMTFGLVVASLGLFYCVDKINFKDPRDIAVTYFLLIGAIALDVIAFMKLLTSNWLTISIKKLPEIDLKDPTPYADGSGDTSRKPCNGYYERLLRFLFRRWSESVSSYNLISYCLNPRPPLKEKIIDFLKLTDFLDGYKYVEQKPFTVDLRKHIFDELHKKSMAADDMHFTKLISAAKGDWTLRVEGCTQFLPFILEVDYGQSLLMWHIATELCYNDDVADTGKLTDEVKNHRQFSKLLSDYMLYLLVRQPEMMSKTARMGQVSFRDTCAEANDFFASKYLRRKKKEASTGGGFFNYVCRAMITLIPRLVAYVISGSDMKRDNNDEEKLKQACSRILAVNTEVKPVAVKGNKSRSVLFDGCILAKELRNLEDNRKWLLMSKVWVEIMSYAAINCKADIHAQQLSKGGELITIVWLLMVHFGFGDQFKIETESLAMATLVVGK